MPRKFFRRLSARYRPNHERWYLGPFRRRLAQKHYLAVNRRSIAGGLWFGVFFGCQPIPVQTLLAIGGSLAARVNPAVAALAVWVSNPLTYAPLLYAEYRIGARLLGREFVYPGLSWSSLGTVAVDLWLPLLLGALVLGAMLATAAFFCHQLAVALVDPAHLPAALTHRQLIHPPRPRAARRGTRCSHP